MKYGLDIKAPTTQPDDDGWRPVLLNQLTRQTFATVDELFAFKDRFEQTNPTLKTRVVELYDEDAYYHS